MSSPQFRVVRTLTGRHFTYLPTRTADCAHDVAVSVWQLCEGLSLLCGPWLWEGFPVAMLRQPGELDSRLWGAS